MRLSKSVITGKNEFKRRDFAFNTREEVLNISMMTYSDARGQEAAEHTKRTEG